MVGMNRYDDDTMILSELELETVELEKSTAQPGRTLKAACEFSNHNGGTIYFGMNDPGEIIMQYVSDTTLENVFGKVRQKIKPEITIGGTNEDNTTANKEYPVLGFQEIPPLLI